MKLPSSTEPESKRSLKQSLSLRRLLLAVSFFGLFLGLTRLASGGFGIATIPAIAALALSVGVLTRRYVLAFSVTFSFAFASYATTSILWDGGFPFAELRIKIVDEQGNPIERVRLSVTRADGTTANGYPISEYEGSAITSGNDGVIVCHQMRRGLQFGGHAWMLFWCVPMGAKSPEFNVHFEHPQFASKTITIGRLFDSEYSMYDEFPKTAVEIHGNVEEIPIYNQRIVLSRR